MNQATKVFAALADPTRTQLLDILGSEPGCTASTLAERVDVTRQAVTQHLTVLTDCSLVKRQRRGREVLFTVQPDQLAVAADWLAGRAIAWRNRLEALKDEAENTK